MRSHFLAVAGIIYLAILVITIHSCSVEKCLGVACNKGTCVNGSCNCNTGYEGKSCDSVIITKFFSVYNVNSTCFPSETYLSKIDYITTTDLTQVSIINLSNLGMTVTADVSNSVDLTISPQTENGGGQTWVISGSGSIDATHTVITFNMTYYDAANNLTEHCTEVYTKKPS